MEQKIKLKSRIHAGNFKSDACYADRNWENFMFACALSGDCYPEVKLKNCLSKAGEKDWWKDFPDMTKETACKMTKLLANDPAVIKQMEC